LKELLDNALDAAENAGVSPRIDVLLWRRGRLLILAVRDNGKGIAREVVERVFDFQVFVSDKAAYRAPTRGAQGNALKTVLGIPVALGVRSPLVIISQGIRHKVRAWIDPAGEVQRSFDQADVKHRPGTLVAVPLPAKKCRLGTLSRWVQAFALFNPHATILVRIRKTGKTSEHCQHRR
jgi:DNA topoisomerase VI subunit B